MNKPLRKRVYIAGPMSLGDRVDNFANALKAMRSLMAAGVAPLCPQLSFFADPFIGAAHGDWVAIDLPWVSVADAVLRLPGESRGADAEVETAVRHGVPVFTSEAALLAWFATPAAAAA